MVSVEHDGLCLLCTLAGISLWEERLVVSILPGESPTTLHLNIMDDIMTLLKVVTCRFQHLHPKCSARGIHLTDKPYLVIGS